MSDDFNVYADVDRESLHDWLDERPEPVQAQDVLDGREQAELRHEPLPPRTWPLGVPRGQPVFPEQVPGGKDRE